MADDEEITFDHEARPDDEPGQRNTCKVCGEDILWMGSFDPEWLHVGDPRS